MVPRSAAVALAACISASLAACGDDGGPPPAVELGVGTVGWEPLDTDDDLELIAGPQGGHHFVLHARMRGIAPGDPDRPGLDDNPATLFQIFTEDGRQVDAQFPPYRLGFRPDLDGWYVLPSGRIVQFIEAEVEGLYDTRVRVVLRVRDDDGNEASDERWVQAVAEENPADTPDAGVPDAGAPDAGVPDAAP